LAILSLATRDAYTQNTFCYQRFLSSSMIQFVSHAPALVRLALLTLAYAVVLFAALWLAVALRFDFRIPPEFMERFWWSAAWIIPLKLVLLWIFGQFRSLITFFSFPDARRLAYALLLAGLVMSLVWFGGGAGFLVPRGAIITDLVLSFLGLVSLRFAFRLVRERLLSPKSEGAKRKRTLILGAGVAGADLLRDIHSKPGLGLHVVGFLDDSPAKIGNRLHGLPILGPCRRLKSLAGDLELQQVILAMPGASPGKIKELVAAANACGLDHRILPSVDQVLHGHVTVGRLRHVEPDDLLNRGQVAPNDGQVRDLVEGTVVMVTGAGGSVGAELCRQVAELNPARLLLVERAEAALFEIDRELQANFPHLAVEAFASDVRDRTRMSAVFRNAQPALVFHAAAHKHVSLMEAQPEEAFANNVIGTATLAELAMAHGVEKFILVSTDKAVRPAGVMGATKRLAEMVLSAHHAAAQGRCVFAAVRFGNVLGSSGSVVPIFREQIAAGGPVTVTHPDATRYFMALSEAAGLILQSAVLARGGEIFVLDMGEPLKIVDLARQMIELSGFEPEWEVPIVFTGLRPGEKLREELAYAGENPLPTSHPKVWRLHDPSDETSCEDLLEQIEAVDHERLRDPDDWHGWLGELVPDYVRVSGN